MDDASADLRESQSEGRPESTPEIDIDYWTLLVEARIIQPG